MTPMFFGASESPLFGQLHEPEGDARGHGIILCPPVGQEHVRSHWAFRQVALALGRAGFHSLRFDWSGVGDSSGDLATATLARFTDDAAEAAQELRDATGVRKVSLVGLRLGATVAALAAARIKPSCLVLWDPVLSGAAHLSELRSLHAELLSGSRRFWREAHRDPGPTELVGFDFGQALLSDIAKIEMASVIGFPKARVCVLGSSPCAEQEALLGALRGRKLEVELHATALRAEWASASEVETLLLPADALRTLTDYLVRRAA